MICLGRLHIGRSCKKSADSASIASENSETGRSSLAVSENTQNNPQWNACLDRAFWTATTETYISVRMKKQQQQTKNMDSVSYKSSTLHSQVLQKSNSAEPVGRRWYKETEQTTTFPVSCPSSSHELSQTLEERRSFELESLKFWC